MKKRIVKILISIICIWFLLIFVDCLLPIKFNKKPIFSIWSEQIKDGGSGTYKGIGYSISISGNFLPMEPQNIYYVKLKVLFIPIFTYYK